MRHASRSTVLQAAVGFVLLWHAGQGRAQIALATGPDAEIIAGDLHRVDPSLMDGAWVTPDLDLSGYTRIYFMPTIVQFRDVEERRYSARSFDSAEEFFVSESRKAQLRELFGAAFYEAVGEAESYELTEEVGRDVLMVRGLLTDVISGVPPEVSGSNLGTIRWAWEANIVMELRDSMSDAVLARTGERERIDGPLDVGAVRPLTQRIVGEWARLLTRRLATLSELSGQ